MADPYIGEIRAFAFNYTPAGNSGYDWIWCNGQPLPIAQFQALFSIIGIRYGGDGKTNFCVPDLQGRVAAGYNATDAAYAWATHGGTNSVALNAAQIPSHSHVLTGLKVTGTTNTPSNSQYLAGLFVSSSESWTTYHLTDSANMVSLAPTMVSVVGNGGAHENRQPYLTMNFCIAANGVYPIHS